MAWNFLLNGSPLARFNREKFLNKSRSSGIWTATNPLIKRLRRESYWTIGRGEIFVSHFCEWLDIIPPKEVEQWMVKDIINVEGIRNKLMSWLPNVTTLIINSFHLNDLPDRLSWRVAPSGRFSAKAFYEYRRKTMSKDKIFGAIWQGWIPPKISGFVWKFFQFGLFTDDAVIKLGIPITSKCRCCKMPNKESLLHLFLTSEVAKDTWNFLGMLFDKRVPSSLAFLKREWFLLFKPNNYMACLALAMSCCALWEIWNFRNCIMADKAPSCIRKKLIHWAAQLAPLIKAPYSKSFANSITLDILQVSEPTISCSGQWNVWFPGYSGSSLSLAFSDCKAAAILRDHKGTFKCGVVANIQEDDLCEAVITLMEYPDLREAHFSYVSSSHKDISSLHSDVFEGSWEKFVLWRKAKEKFSNCLIKSVPPILNEPAIALSCFTFDSLPREFRDIQSLPPIVQHHLLDDYLKLPKWCRKDGLRVDPCCHCYDMFRCTPCRQKASDVHNAAGLILGA